MSVVRTYRGTSDEVCPNSNGKIQAFSLDVSPPAWQDAGDVSFGDSEGDDSWLWDDEYVVVESGSFVRVNVDLFRVNSLVCGGGSKTFTPGDGQVLRVVPSEPFLPTTTANTTTLGEATSGFVYAVELQGPGSPSDPVAYVSRSLNAWWGAVDAPTASSSSTWVIDVGTLQWLRFNKVLVATHSSVEVVDQSS